MAVVTYPTSLKVVIQCSSFPVIPFHWYPPSSTTILLWEKVLTAVWLTCARVIRAHLIVMTVPICELEEDEAPKFYLLFLWTVLATMIAGWGPETHTQRRLTCKDFITEYMATSKRNARGTIGQQDRVNGMSSKQSPKQNPQGTLELWWLFSIMYFVVRYRFYILAAIIITCSLSLERGCDLSQSSWFKHGAFSRENCHLRIVR